jgi:hypothetical protein
MDCLTEKVVRYQNRPDLRIRSTNESAEKKQIIEKTVAFNRLVHEFKRSLYSVLTIDLQWTPQKIAKKKE